ncbi:MAG: dTDP-glucose 4,6-dehydratase [Deltaproteobacteria bacterium]
MKKTTANSQQPIAILVTGGAGFIGSNFIRMILNEELQYKVINLDALTYAGNLNNLKDVEDNPDYTFIKGDIRDNVLVDDIFKKYNPGIVINFAAESHVDRSIDNPEEFLDTNIMGTFTLLEAAKKHGMLTANSQQPTAKFIQISTDEVYGELGEEGLFSEESPLAPNSPYSASKASADMLAKAYFRTYGLPVIITRCSNNYGPYQFPEKLIPLMISNALEDKALPVYGEGMNVRDWIHVDDHCRGLIAVIKNGVPGEVYNFGSNNERKNIEIVKIILQHLGKSEELIKYIKDRPGHDKRYAMNPKKAMKEIGWKPLVSFEKGIESTINWYMNNMEWWEEIKNGEYKEYYNKMYSNR